MKKKKKIPGGATVYKGEILIIIYKQFNEY